MTSPIDIEALKAVRQGALVHGFGEAIHIDHETFVAKVVASVFCRSPAMSGDDRDRLNSKERSAVDQVASEVIKAIDHAILSLIARTEAAEGENEQLRLAICGGEDVPGLAASLPLHTVLGIQHDNVATSRSALERLWTEQARIAELIAQRDGLVAVLEGIAKRDVGPSGRIASAALSTIKAGGGADE